MGSLVVSAMDVRISFIIYQGIKPGLSTLIFKLAWRASNEVPVTLYVRMQANYAIDHLQSQLGTGYSPLRAASQHNQSLGSKLLLAMWQTACQERPEKR